MIQREKGTRERVVVLGRRSKKVTTTLKSLGFSFIIIVIVCQKHFSPLSKKKQHLARKITTKLKLCYACPSITKWALIC